MIDIIMQGPIWPRTLSDAQGYLSCPLVNSVIISTWKGEQQLPASERISIIYSDNLQNPGMGNRNRQIYSSRVGVERSTAPVVVKSRTDQRIDDLEKMYNYFMANYKIDVDFLDGSGPKGSIFVMGLFTRLPFHPQDHLFWGWREDVKALFDAPLSSEIPNPNQVTDNSGAYTDYARSVTRPNTYIGMHYYARFDARIQHMVHNPKEYLVDLAPSFEEAINVDSIYRDKVFKAFPRVQLWWYKHNRDYPYDWGVPYTEYHG